MQVTEIYLEFVIYVDEVSTLISHVHHGTELLRQLIPTDIDTRDYQGVFNRLVN